MQERMKSVSKDGDERADREKFAQKVTFDDKDDIKTFMFTYTNHRGETNEYTVKEPIEIYWRKTDYYPDGGWMMYAQKEIWHDIEEGRRGWVEREFLMKNISHCNYVFKLC